MLREFPIWAVGPHEIDRPQFTAVAWTTEVEPLRSPVRRFDYEYPVSYCVRENAGGDSH
jgi:hypothetical protein